jgi:cell division protein ZapA (FtsZ GTPase activity inhibitor)
MFHDWPLALAAYNCGEGGLQNAMRSQNVHNYYQLELPRENRTLCVQNYCGQNYSFRPQTVPAFILTNIICFPPNQFEKVTINLRQSTHLREIAQQYGSYYREIRLLNPEIQTDSLPAGMHTIKVPKDWQQLVTSLPRQRVSSDDYAVTDDNSIIYTVQPGDSVSKIAQRFNVNASNIRKIKGRDTSLSEIYPGEQLLIVTK